LAPIICWESTAIRRICSAIEADAAADGDTKLPGNLRHLNILEAAVYGDFTVRVLEPLQPGHQQAACIVDVYKLVR
jgi:hypothetical protein